MKRIWRSFYVFIVNLAVFFALYSIVCGFFFFSIPRGEIKEETGEYDSNTIRSTYPNYDEFSPDSALSIFREYAAAKSSYLPFTGYRRAEFSGAFVNVGRSGFRKSKNESHDKSVWFLGGSTMWGTGATDDTTIPSFFSELSGQSVLNVGESGYSSFQELVQLEVLLVAEYKPSQVVFYDGVNDGYYSCKKDEPLPTHAYRSRYSEYVSKYSELRRRIEGSAAKQAGVLSLGEFLAVKYDFANMLREYYGAPLEYFGGRKAVALRSPSSLDSERKISDMEKRNRYLFCDDPVIAERAARVLIRSWLIAFSVLKERDVSVIFVLQPTATYNPLRYNLQYLIDSEKQKILDEEHSYYEFYSAVRRIWHSECAQYGACDSFIDFSDLFFDSASPVFIDAYHVSPSGNKKIAQRLGVEMKRAMPSKSSGAQQ